MNIRKLILIAIPVFFSFNVQAIDIKSKLIELNQRPITCGVIGEALGTASYFAYKAWNTFEISEKFAPVLKKTKARLTTLNKKPIICAIVGAFLGTGAALTYRHFAPKDDGYMLIEL